MLVGQALQERPHDQIHAIIDRFARNPDFIADYLWRELIQRQPEERQQFLLRTSILDQFNAAGLQCGHRADPTLNRCWPPWPKRTSFSSRWASEDPGFGTIISSRMCCENVWPERSLQDEILELHVRAARWYRAEGLVEEAATHAIKAQDWELAVEILTPICSELFRLERLTSVCAWLDQLPTRSSSAIRSSATNTPGR